MSTRGMAVLPGDFQFCPYCGNATIESNSVRTCCFTCGSDVVTDGRVEMLENEVALLTDALVEAETDRDGFKKEHLAGQEKIISLQEQLDALDAENQAWQQQIAALAPVQP